MVVLEHGVKSPLSDLQKPNPTAQKLPVPPPPKTSGDTVVVACKLPAGAKLRVHTWVVRQTILAAGSKVEERVAEPTGESVTLNGSALDPAMLAAGRFPEHPIVGGYALTPHVPREFWERWLEENAESDLVKNHIIFAHGTEASARDASKTHEKQLSGLEPIDPADPGAKTGMRRLIEPGDRPR